MTHGHYPSTCGLTRPTIAIVLVLLAMAARASASGRGDRQQPRPTGVASQSKGAYADLAPYQQRLFAQVLRRYNAITRSRLAVSEAYDALAPSRRTTFEAVTNALHTTPLTDASGAPLGSALDIVSAIDDIAGQTRGARGDRQFRLYVLLAPDAMDRLTRSREFSRSADNTIYHPGYPVSFRLRGGTPSIQVSISRDGRRGDIDVDYRSSSFPVALFNGHLTSANSDVRAGGNYQRHQGRWTGLGNWWERLLGIFSGAGPVTSVDSRPGVIPVEPRQSSGASIEAVVEDFLDAWLVESRPELSAAYFSPLSFGCLAPAGSARVGQGLERYSLLERMKAANDAMGRVDALPRAALSVNPWDPRLEVRPHRRATAFLLARVPAEVASAYDCANRTGAVPTLGDGEYFVSAFRLRVPGGPAPVLVLLWTRERSGFRIVATDVEEAAEPSLPIGSAARPSITRPRRARRVEGPAPLIETATAFHRAWFLDHDLDRTLSYFDTGAYPCLEAVSAGAMPGTRTSMRTMLGQVADRVQHRGSLSAAIRTTDPDQEGVDVVRHAEQSAFTLAPVGDSVFEAARCATEPPAAIPAGSTGGAVDLGRTYVSYFHLNVPGDPAFLLMLWVQHGTHWKIAHWTVITP
jgi:hypothetical protein